MRGSTITGLLAATLVLGGCTTFTTNLTSHEVGTKTTPGLTYRLPAKQFSLATTYQVTGCKVTGPNVSLEADVKTTLTERLIGAEAYTINYRKLNSWTKMTNAGIQLSEAGLLTGINASMADQSGAIIQNAVATAAGIARAVALPATPLLFEKKIEIDALLYEGKTEKAAEQLQLLMTQMGGAATPIDLKSLTRKDVTEGTERLLAKVPKPSCSEIDELLKQQKDAEDALKSSQKDDKSRAAAKRGKNDAEAEIARLAALKDVYEALGREKDRDGLIARIQEQEKRLADASANLDRLGESGTEKATQELANAVAALTITAINDFLPAGPGKTYKATLTEGNVPPRLRASKSFNIKTTALPEVTFKVDVPGASEDSLAAGVKPASPAMPGPEGMGIAYRTPVAAIARVQCKCPLGIRTLIETPTQVPQFGPVGLLDLENGAFANNNLEVVFNGATGAPEKLVFHSESRAQAVSAAARTASDAYLQLQKDKRDDILAANKAAIDQQTALLTLAKTRTDASLAAAQAGATAALLPVTTEKSLVAAQIDLLRDQQRLDAVRTGTASAAEVQLEALVNQQKLLEQQLKILQVEQQIAEQKAKAQAESAP